MKLTTTNLNLPRARWPELSPPAAAALAIFFLLLIGLIVGRVRSTPSVLLHPTPALDPIIIIASPLPQGPVPTAAPVQVAAVAPNALRRAVVAYDSPSGNVLGAIEQGRVYTVLARFGSDWLQADVQGSGVVWMKADQVLDLPAGLADLEPTQAPVIVERPVYVAAPMPAVATPETGQFQVAAEQPQTLQQAAILDRQQWAMDAQRAGR